MRPASSPVRAGRRRVVLLGPPGSGKGTQGRLLATGLDVAHVSSGEVLRSSVAAGDPYGFAAVMARGGLVDDGVLRRLILGRLPPHGFVLDGFPRTATQAADLDEALGRDALDTVVELVVPEDVLTRRLLERAVKSGRTDDTPETVATRFEVYREEIAELRGHYAKRLRSVEGVGTVEEVAARVLAAAG